MPCLISESSNYYKTSRDVQVADRVYPKVYSHITKDFIDVDGYRKMVNYLDSGASSFVSYVKMEK